MEKELIFPTIVDPNLLRKKACLLSEEERSELFACIRVLEADIKSGCGVIGKNILDEIHEILSRNKGELR